MGVVLLLTLLVFLPNTADGGRNQVCPEGWRKGGSKCFKLVDEKTETPDAHRRCKNNHKASLAVIENEAENKVVQDLLGGQSSAWIGLRRKYGSYKWNNEYEFQYSYSNWASGRTYGECVMILSTGEWRRSYCFLDRPYVCFKKADCEPGWTGDRCDRQCHCYQGYVCNV
ncbi:snaclec bothroinsularin subunit alpha-like [Haliotis rubra]|uniref:snaclec bothroinsularin subunit alpha-like n=1 Tax=Haliotis rubra TaxID=36100 RepID=UPI001EE622CA|nr:snaclec bothroinsularin subunit alpha-like [Haliotis rubra]